MVDEELVIDEGFYAALSEDDPAELYDNAPCGYLSTLPDGTIIKVNGTFLAWTGHGREDLVGRRRFQELLAPGDRIFYETHFSPLLRMQGRIREIAVEVVGADGGRLPVLVNSVLTRSPNGDPLVIRTAIFDATERRAYEQELVAARRRAEESEARASALARTLQSTFLPPTAIAIPGLDVGGAYRPAGDGSEVGGDFYDVFETGLGSWAIVLGDVCGKGVEAAALTALARHTVRAESLHEPSPAAVLQTLHAALLRSHPDRFCTAVLAFLEPGEAATKIRMASGGHHLPLRLRGEQLDSIGEVGTILGMLDEAVVCDAEAELVAGDLLLMYTDGVTEARHGDAFLDDAGLAAALRSAAGGSAQEIADSIVGAALDFQGGIAHDDMAVVAIRSPGAG